MTARKPSRKSTGQPTLRDVARAAGVSIKTVSRVVNEEQNVSAATSARVNEAISRLEYQPNELARSLRARNSHTIGLIIADISNPFYAACAKAVEGVAQKHGYSVVVCSSDENVETEQAYINLLTRRRVEGLLLVPAAVGHEYYRAEGTLDLPLLALDRPMDEASTGTVTTDTVIVQNRLGAREATEHLIGHGHQRVAFIGAQEHLYTTRKRLEGYREALRGQGLEEMVRLEAPDAVSAARAAQALLEFSDPPTALFTMNNLITVGVLQTVEKAGLRVPKDLALVGFDDFELASVLHPRLTLVRQPASELGQRAAELLFERLEGNHPPDPQRIVLETELIIRESCGCKV